MRWRPGYFGGTATRIFWGSSNWNGSRFVRVESIERHAMSTLRQDLRYGFRRLRQSTGFALACVITLALGIGANTAIFTLIDAVMLKSLPVANPKELYRLGNNGNCCGVGGLQQEWSIFSYDLYKDFRDNEPQFSQMAAFQGGEESLN